MRTIFEFGGYRVEAPTDYPNEEIPSRLIVVYQKIDGEWQQLTGVTKFQFTLDGGSFPNVMVIQRKVDALGRPV